MEPNLVGTTDTAPSQLPEQNSVKEAPSQLPEQNSVKESTNEINSESQTETDTTKPFSEDDLQLLRSFYQFYDEQIDSGHRRSKPKATSTVTSKSPNLLNEHYLQSPASYLKSEGSEDLTRSAPNFMYRLFSSLLPIS